MATGENIKKLRLLCGLTLEQLSELSGVEVGTISALEVRDSSRSKFFPNIAKAFGITSDELASEITSDQMAWAMNMKAQAKGDAPEFWLTTAEIARCVFDEIKNKVKLSPSSNTKLSESSAESAGNVIAIHPDDDLPDGMINVMEYRVSFSAGNGHTPNYELIEEREPATYRLSWFQRERINPNNVKRFKVTGDSMEPFLYSGDSVLVNLAENDPTRIVDGKVYAIRYGDELRVKRLHRRLDGTLTLRSENPAYKDEDVPPELAEEHITIIGRVRDKSGAGGL